MECSRSFASVLGYNLPFSPINLLPLFVMLQRCRCRRRREEHVIDIGVVLRHDAAAKRPRPLRRRRLTRASRHRLRKRG